MKLDSRIAERKHIYDVFNADKAKSFIGEECYMTNDIELYKDLDMVTIYRLDRIDVNSFFYNEEEDEYFDFCLPIKLLNQKKRSICPCCVEVKE